MVRGESDGERRGDDSKRRREGTKKEGRVIMREDTEEEGRVIVRRESDSER